MTSLIILGSGMSTCFASDELDIIGQESGVTVEGHSGKLALLRSSHGEVMIALGRRHLYEGHSLDDVQTTVRYAASLGARNLIVTNAAGGLNPRFNAGDIMLINDTIGSLFGRRLAVEASSNIDADLQGVIHHFATELYDDIEAAAMERGVRLHSGVYAGVTGPSYETRAEIRMLRRMGADAVGMSTVPEVIAAKQASMRAIGLSLITNVLTDAVRVALNHEEVVEQGRLARESMRRVIDAALTVALTPALSQRERE